MKKFIISLLVVGALALTATQNVDAQKKKLTTLTVGVNPVPHAVLLEQVKADLLKKGIDLKIVVFTDYIQPNDALLAKDLDANYFQTIPYLESNPRWKAAFSFIWGIHVEPYGLYSAKYKKIADIPNGATIGINNDPANQGRALLLLQDKGLITLKSKTDLRQTPRDIVSNPKNLKFRELDAAQLPRSLQDLDAATINGNYAIEAGLGPKDSLAIESGVNSPYANGLVVRKGEENDPRFEELRKALQSAKIKSFIGKTYKDGSVIAAF